MATQKIYTPEEAKAALAKLPQGVRQLLYSPEMRAALSAAGEKNKLHLDQLAALERETAAVMLGFTETQDYPEMIGDALNLDTEKATAVAKDVSDSLFTKIRDALKQETATPPAVPSPITPPAPKPVETPPPPAPKVPEIHPADLMLSQKTVSSAPPAQPTAKPEPPKPGIYKADPYREPPV